MIRMVNSQRMCNPCVNGNKEFIYAQKDLTEKYFGNFSIIFFRYNLIKKILVLHVHVRSSVYISNPIYIYTIFVIYYVFISYWNSSRKHVIWVMRILVSKISANIQPYHRILRCSFRNVNIEYQLVKAIFSLYWASPNQLQGELFLLSPRLDVIEQYRSM